MNTPEVEKQFATLQAKAAIALVELHRVESDNGRPSFVATQWAITRRFESLDHVADWLDRFNAREGAGR